MPGTGHCQRTSLLITPHYSHANKFCRRVKSKTSKQNQPKSVRAPNHSSIYRKPFAIRPSQLQSQIPLPMSLRLPHTRSAPVVRRHNCDTAHASWKLRGEARSERNRVRMTCRSSNGDHRDSRSVTILSGSPYRRSSVQSGLLLVQLKLTGHFDHRSPEAEAGKDA